MRVSFVASRVIVTLAPGTTPPLESLTNPRISVEVVCPSAETAEKSRTAKTALIWTAFPVSRVYHFLKQRVKESRIGKIGIFACGEAASCTVN
jgi:hypothetical protein